MELASVVSYEEDPVKKEDLPSQLPEPTGYRLLVMPRTVDEKTKGGIVLPDERRDKENAASILYCVLKLGSDAYKDKAKFPNGPWCEKGDWVILPAYAGTRVRVRGIDFRIVNDDTVQAIVEDPRGVGRA